MRIRDSGGLTWRVSGKTLSVTARGVTYVYQLTGKTISELAGEIQGSGITIEYLNPEQSGRGAVSLLAGDGDQDQSNGDHLLVHENLLWSLFGAYDEELIAAEAQSHQAIRQMVIPDSEGEWLDLWGRIYGEPRRTGESDASYAARIPIEVFRERVNPRAIELAIRDATGRDVRIEEPWQNIARWDTSTLDGPDRLYDGVRIGYHIIQPVTADYVDWQDVMPIIHRNRPSGVLVLDPMFRLAFSVDASGHEVHFGHYSLKAAQIPYEDKMLWDFAEFGDTPIPNREAAHIRERIFGGPAVYDDAGYGFEFTLTRDFRVTFVDVRYMRQAWDASLTWAEINSTWDNWNDVGPAGHTRS